MFRKFSVILGLTGLVLAMPMGVQAATVRSMEKGTVTVGKQEIVNDDLFIHGETVVIDGVVNGDVFAVGESVTINGTVNGDVYAGAGKVEIMGTVKDDVVVGTGNLNMKHAKIGDSLIVGAGNVILDEGTSIGGGVMFGAGMLESRAKIGRGVTGGGGDVTLDGWVGRDVMVGTGNLRIDKSASVSGNVRYTSDKELSLAPGASISGTVSKIADKEMPISPRDKARLMGAWTGMKMATEVWSYLAALVTGLVVLWLVPLFRRISEVAQARPGKSLVVGLLVCILAVPVFLVLAMTIVGLPLALILGLLLVVESYFAKLVVGLAIGNWLAERFDGKNLQAYGRFGLGLLAYYVLTMIPVVGWLASLVGFLWGFGAIKLWKWEYLKKLRTGVLKS